MSSVRKQASIATLAVSGSRVAGLLREMAFAFFFGAGPAIDAFIAAFRIPNLLRDLFAEGALSNAFVTVFSKKQAKEGNEKAWELGTRVHIFLIFVLGLVTVLGIFFSPTIVHLIASGFEGGKFDLTVRLNRLLFPFILFVSLAAIAMGMLNAKGKFALPQSASTFFNVTSILTGLLFAYIMEPEVILFPFSGFQGDIDPSTGLTWRQMIRGITGMAYGTLLGGIVQWLIQLPSLLKMGFKFQKKGKLMDDSLKQVLKLTGPAIIGGAAVQINVLVNTNFASYLADGSIAWLNYAFRLMQFPIGVFGVAIALATTPAIAMHAGQNDTENFKKTLRESTQMTLFLCIPSALGLIFLARPILSLIYEHGRFSAFDTYQASHALMAYAVGLSSYALIKIYQPAFLAHDDAKTPMVISLFSILVNFLVNWVLVFVFHFQHWGLALGTSLVALLNGILLIVLLRKKIPGIWSKSLVFEGIKISITALVAVLCGWLLYGQLTSLMAPHHLLQKFILVFLPMSVVCGAYYFLCIWWGVTEAGLIKEWLKKKFRPAP